MVDTHSSFGSLLQYEAGEEAADAAEESEDAQPERLPAQQWQHPSNAVADSLECRRHAAGGAASSSLREPRSITLTVAPASAMLPSVFASSSHSLPGDQLQVGRRHADERRELAFTAPIFSDGSHSSVCVEPRPATESVIISGQAAHAAFPRRAAHDIPRREQLTGP